MATIFGLLGRGFGRLGAASGKRGTPGEPATAVRNWGDQADIVASDILNWGDQADVSTSAVLSWGDQ